MTSVAKHLACALEIILDTRVVALTASRHLWSAETETRAVYSAGAVVLTPPVPQSLAILKAGAVPLQPETRARLEGIAYERCLAVMAALANPSRLAPPGGLAPDDGPIAWIADNQLKGISAEPAVTIHATHASSLEHWERDRQESGRRLLDAASDWLGAKVRTFQVHGWLYSKPLQVDECPCTMVGQVPPLVQEEYVRALIAANGKLVSDAARARDVAGEAGDAESQDLMIGRITLHQKTVWMLKSFLKAWPNRRSSVARRGTSRFALLE